ncbi:MAG: hypothetical protein J0M04_16205 [Verrucomicrobia bacterium]|nr:hypothetical protein [Verrucomicrobiota bacterium]
MNPQPRDFTRRGPVSPISRGLSSAAVGLLVFAGMGFVSQIHAAAPSSVIVAPTYQERCGEFVRYLASATPRNPDFPKEAMPYYAARLQLGADPAATVKAIDHMLDATAKARPDPFNMHAVMHAFLLYPDRFTEPMRAKVKRIVSTPNYGRPAGVSLNYELMRGGAGYLAAQQWPDLKDSAGNGSAVIASKCRDYLMKQFSGTCSRNASEYDAPVYYGTDFGPARMVAEFSKDPQLARAARMTLDFMLIQTGAHWHNGYHISSAGRGKYWGSLNLGPRSASPTNAMAYLLYGSKQPFNMASAPQAYWLAHPGRALDHATLGKWQASLPDRRTVLANQIWPTHDQIVHKVAWFTDTYGLASQREDGSSHNSFLFKECRRTMLKWHSPQAASTFTVLQENRRRPQEKIGNAFAYGENPYCQTLQHEGTLIGVYDVPETYGFWITRAPFTTTGAIVSRRERDGWILCHGGGMLFAFRFTEPALWGKPNTRENLELWRCNARRGGWVLETSDLKPFAGGGPEAELQRFGQALAERTRLTAATGNSPPRLLFRNLRGRTLDILWKPLSDKLTDQCKVDGKAVRYDDFPLLGAPNASQESGGPLTLTVGGRKRVWDFDKWTIRDVPAGK